jgi:predicted small secreted protein
MLRRLNGLVLLVVLGATALSACGEEIETVSAGVGALAQPGRVIPPAVMVDSHPAGTAYDREAFFGMKASMPVQYECAIDGEPIDMCEGTPPLDEPPPTEIKPNGAYSDGSAGALDGVSWGDHVFWVRAVVGLEAGGRFRRASVPAEFHWTVPKPRDCGDGEFGPESYEEAYGINATFVDCTTAIDVARNELSTKCAGQKECVYRGFGCGFLGYAGYYHYECANGRQHLTWGTPTS